MKTYKAILSPHYEQPDERLLDEYTVEAPDLWKAREMIADMIDETMYTCDRSAVCPPVLMVAFDPNAEHCDIIFNIYESDDVKEENTMSTKYRMYPQYDELFYETWGCKYDAVFSLDDIQHFADDWDVDVWDIIGKYVYEVHADAPTLTATVKGRNVNYIKYEETLVFTQVSDKTVIVEVIASTFENHAQPKMLKLIKGTFRALAERYINSYYGTENLSEITFTTM